MLRTHPCREHHRWQRKIALPSGNEHLHLLLPQSSCDFCCRTLRSYPHLAEIITFPAGSRDVAFCRETSHSAESVGSVLPEEYRSTRQKMPLLPAEAPFLRMEPPSRKCHHLTAGCRRGRKRQKVNKLFRFGGSFLVGKHLLQRHGRHYFPHSKTHWKQILPVVVDNDLQAVVFCIEKHIGSNFSPFVFGNNKGEDSPSEEFTLQKMNTEHRRPKSDAHALYGAHAQCIGLQRPCRL